MKFVCTTILFVALALSATAAFEHYYNCSLYRLRPQNALQLSLLQQIEEEGADFWRGPDMVNRFADVMLTPQNKERVLDMLSANGIKYELIVPDVEKRIEEERREQQAVNIESRAQWPGNIRANETISTFWKTYQRYSQHVKFVDELVSQNLNLASKIIIGQSYQGRDLVVVRIGAGSSSSKPIIWIEGGIHAREWISPATVTYFAHQLVLRYNSGDADVTKLLNKFDFYILPVINVDGYEYTHTNSRLWRKTRRPSSKNPSCIGADPNRNFGYKWGGQGASTNACSETYRGDSAFSEPEPKAESEYILSLKNRVKAFLAVHSYGQYWLYPWGYTSALTPDDKELNAKANIAVSALTKLYNTRYTIGTSTNVLYAAAGGADDWAYGGANVTYSYTVELRDTGSYGFQLPASQIIPTGEETTRGFIAFALSL